MLKDQLGARDGITVESFKKDQEYQINGDLAEIFVKLGYAKKVDEAVQVEAEAEVLETKVDLPEEVKPVKLGKSKKG
jgi:hypothetical protein